MPYLDTMMCLFTDTAGPDQVFPRDHHHRLRGLQDPRTAVVPYSQLVLSRRVQLLLLRREHDHLLWRVAL